jgi:hypothetical protein
MKKSFAAFAIGLALLLGVNPQPARAYVLTRTTFTNNSDAWAWVTGYNDKGDHARGGSFCLAPGQEVIKEYSDFVARMRFEFTSSGCSHPVRKDLWVSFGAVIRFYLQGNAAGGYSARTAACHGDTKHCLYYR